MHNTHPSMRPGAIIGYRRNGTPIRLIAGGAPDDKGDGAGDGQDGAGADNGGQQAGGTQDGGSSGTGGQDSNAGTGSSGQAGSTEGGTAPAADDSAARTIAAIREDYKQERTKRQALQKDLETIKQQQAQQAEETKQRNRELAKALGITTDEPPDPEKLAADLAAERKAREDQVTQSQARERELTVELELLKQARKHGADPELLADSRSFMSKLGKLDPASEDFAEDLGAAIKAAVEANPGFGITTGSSGTSNASGNGGSGDGSGAAGGDSQQGKPRQQQGKTTAPPARSGTDGGHNGAPGGNRQWTDDDVKRASPQELTQAIADGLLVDLGVNPPKKSRR
jgi:hypothetical protein